MSGVPHARSPWTYRGSLGPRSNQQLKGPFVIEDASGAQVAIVSGWRNEQTKSNARLIAAAPELRAACRISLAVLRGEEMQKQSLIDALQMCADALFKADGES